MSLYFKIMYPKDPITKEEYLFFRDHRKDIKDVQMLADILDALRKGYFHYENPITLSELNLYANDKSNSYYHQFYIKKKNGGKRLISAPVTRLKEIQGCIRILLSWNKPHLTRLSIANSASKHVGKDVVCNFDIKNFYPSINIAQILQKLLSLGYKYDVAFLLASLVTIRSEDGIPVLSQGSPSSPVISNLILEHLDARLSGFARKHGISYSRYVDDITFSFSMKDPRRIYTCFIKKIIETEGFQINEKKSRVSFYYQRQVVTGLTVNKQLNVNKQFIKQLRTIIHNWEKDGYILATNKLLVNYYKNMVNPKRKLPKLEDVVAGKLSYLKMVRRLKRVKNSENPEEKEFCSLWDIPLDNPDGYSIIKTIDPLWNKLHDRYVALLARDFTIIQRTRTSPKKNISLL